MRAGSALLIAALAGSAVAQKNKPKTMPPMTVAPTAAPTAAPTSAPIPADEVCVQGVQPPGVKPGSCLQNVCAPASVKNGETFHTTVRWCLQYPRVYHVAFNLLNIETKEYYGGEGWDSYTESQCGEHTFEHTMDAANTAGGGIAPDSLMWKFFVTPIWGEGSPDGPEGWVQDTFPNMLAECGIPVQPNYQQPLSGDCPVVETRTWTLPDSGNEDRVFYSKAPLPCLTPGEDWTIAVDTHLESAPTADLRVNLQIGTGNDDYLGPEDVYVTEVDFFNITANAAKGNNDNAKGYWTTHQVTFPGGQTQKVAEGDRPYVASFIAPSGSQYNPKLPEGWRFLDREFYLPVELC